MIVGIQLGYSSCEDMQGFYMDHTEAEGSLKDYRDALGERDLECVRG